MYAFDRIFDLESDGHLDLSESAVRFSILSEANRGGLADSAECDEASGFRDDDNADVFADAGLDYEELEIMDPVKRRGVLIEAGLNPEEYDF